MSMNSLSLPPSASVFPLPRAKRSLRTHTLAIGGCCSPEVGLVWEPIRQVIYCPFATQESRLKWFWPREERFNGGNLFPSLN